jgi:hypothetical protein
MIITRKRYSRYYVTCRTPLDLTLPNYVHPIGKQYEDSYDGLSASLRKICLGKIPVVRHELPFTLFEDMESMQGN